MRRCFAQMGNERDGMNTLKVGRELEHCITWLPPPPTRLFIKAFDEWTQKAQPPFQVIALIIV